MSDHLEHVQWGRIGALESWARTTDRAARTSNGRAAFMARFDEYPDPEAARKAYYQRLALKSAQSRRRKKVEREARIAEAVAQEIARARTAGLPAISWRCPFPDESDT